jgi:hypothetical protein
MNLLTSQLDHSPTLTHTYTHVYWSVSLCAHNTVVCDVFLLQGLCDVSSQHSSETQRKLFGIRTQGTDVGKSQLQQSSFRSR